MAWVEHGKDKSLNVSAQVYDNFKNNLELLNEMEGN